MNFYQNCVSAHFSTVSSTQLVLKVPCYRLTLYTLWCFTFQFPFSLFLLLFYLLAYHISRAFYFHLHSFTSIFFIQSIFIPSNVHSLVSSPFFQLILSEPNKSLSNIVLPAAVNIDFSIKISMFWSWFTCKVQFLKSN